MENPWQQVQNEISIFNNKTCFESLAFEMASKMRKISWSTVIKVVYYQGCIPVGYRFSCLFNDFCNKGVTFVFTTSWPLAWGLRPGCRSNVLVSLVSYRNARSKGKVNIDILYLELCLDSHLVCVQESGAKCLLRGKCFIFWQVEPFSVIHFSSIFVHMKIILIFPWVTDLDPRSFLRPANAAEVILLVPCVCLSVCLSPLLQLNRLTYDLNFWDDGWPWSWLRRSRS